MTLALGIDPGIATTGYGLVRDTAAGPVLVRYGVILTPAGAPLPQRLLALHQRLQALLAEHRPDIAAVEKLFFQRNVSTAMTVGQARGVALLALAEAGLPVGEYTPTDVKLAVAGYGGADKTQMQMMVRTILRLTETPKPDDAADALAVAVCHLNSHRFQNL